MLGSWVSRSVHQGHRRQPMSWRERCRKAPARPARCKVGRTPASLLPVTDTHDHERGLRLSTHVYQLRLLGRGVGSIGVAAVFREHHAPAAAWAVLAFHGLVWPHLAFLSARRSADPHRVERASLTIDSGFGGFWIALMHFNLLPSVLIA